MSDLACWVTKYLGQIFSCPCKMVGIIWAITVVVVVEVVLVLVVEVVVISSLTHTIILTFLWDWLGEVFGPGLLRTSWPSLTLD